MAEVTGDPVVTIEPDSTYEEAEKIWPEIGKYRKLLASLITSSVPFAIYLLDPRTPKEVVAATGAFLLVNLGVYGVSND